MVTSEEDSNRPISVHDSSSPSQPLLSSKPSIEEPNYPPDPVSSDPTQFLQIVYNYGPRPFKDLAFLIVFLLFVVLTFGFGIFAICNRNSNFTNVSAFSYSSVSGSCVKQSSSSTSNSLFSSFLYLGSGVSGFSSSSSHLLRDLIWTLVVTAVLSLPFGFGLLLLLKHYTKHIVYICLPFFIILPVFINVYWFVACTVSSKCSDSFPLAYRILVFVFVFLIIGVITWILVINWRRIELTIRIIGIASDALSKNLGLFVVLPLLILGLVVYYAPIVVFLVFARFNGKIVARESNGVYSCVWKQDSWVPAYFTLAVLTMLWSLTVMVEAQSYVISGTTAQWYFSKEDKKPRRSIRSSLRNAFGPSSGTICLSGLLIGVIRLVRAAVDSARQEEAHGFVYMILRCCVNTFLSAIEFVNKFTINFAAITGEGYCSSAKMTYELLKRNLLSAVFVETVSSRLLIGIIFVFSALYAIAVCAILKGATKLGVDSYLVAVLAWVLLLVVLGYFVYILDDVIDCVYICYAIDRDRGEVYKAHVHEVYVHLPISRNHAVPYAPMTGGV